jgi:glycosyltransferase involved in cell wall biosynthesis
MKKVRKSAKRNGTHTSQRGFCTLCKSQEMVVTDHPAGELVAHADETAEAERRRQEATLAHIEQQLSSLQHELSQKLQDTELLRHRLAAIENSLLWRWYQAGRKAALHGRRRLSSALRAWVRTRHTFTLAPLSQVVALDDSGMKWRSVGEDPYFGLRPDHGRIPHGWVLLRFTMRLDAINYMAKLYWDIGNGFSERDSVEVPITLKGTVNHLVKLPCGVRALRWDPTSSPGEIVFQGQFTLIEVGRLEKNWRMLHRILSMGRTRNDSSGNPGVIGEKGGLLPSLLDLERTYTGISRHRANGPPAPVVPYMLWISKYETPEFQNLDAIQSEYAALSLKPLISVVMPTYNTPERFLRRAIDSVLGQSYPHWELCIADDASSDPDVRRLLQEYQAKDARIRVAYRSTNGHISAASNSALELAEGDYVAFLDHDDELAPHALHFAAKALNKHPGAKILYSDEDKIDEEGNRHDPHFKSDWNPDLFLSQNYISHLGIYSARMVREAGGFRVGYEGSQDYDLALRCFATVKDWEVVHIPKVLYHWRTLKGSTARQASEKSYTSDAGIKALADYLAQTAAPAHVERGRVPNTYRVVWQIPEPAPLVSLMIPTRDMQEMLAKCVDSILEKTTYPNYEIIILDNRSQQPETLAWFEQLQGNDRIRVVKYDHPFNYSAINNFGVRHAKGEIIGLINNDIEVISPGWLTEMTAHACRPEIGCVGAKLHYPDGRIQHAGVVVGLGGIAGHSHKYYDLDAPGYFHRLSLVQNYSAVTAACLLVRRSIYEQVGGLNESELKVAFNDVDFCLRVREAGFRNLWSPYATLYHHESISRGAEDSVEKQNRFLGEIEYMKRAWGGKLLRDPSYSPNLTLDREDFSIRS